MTRKVFIARLAVLWGVLASCSALILIVILVSLSYLPGSDMVDDPVAAVIAVVLGIAWIGAVELATRWNEQYEARTRRDR